MGYESGTEALDSMILYINKLPNVDAGPDDTLYIGDSYSLQGEVLFSNDYYWSTSGDGTFNDETLLDAIYTPGSNDILNGEAELTLNAEPIAPCPQGDEDEVLLTIVEYTAINENINTSRIEVSPNPSSGLITVEGIIPLYNHIELQLYLTYGNLRC